MEIDFSKSADRLVPVIVQDASTDKVLMLGYMNAEALDQTQATGKVTFFSRSKSRLWTKGESSGNFLCVLEIKPDCDNDALLIKARPTGPVCHTGNDTCFSEKNKLSGIKNLEQVIADRYANPKADSYTTTLFEKGIPKIAQKVGEEAVELVIEALGKDEALFQEEAADLLYHFLVLLNAKNTKLSDIEEILNKRAK